MKHVIAVELFLMTTTILLSTGCATEFYWAGFRERRGPKSVVAAKITVRDQLYATIRYKNWSLHTVRTTLSRSPRGYAYIQAKLVQQELRDIDGQMIPVVRRDTDSDSRTSVSEKIYGKSTFHVSHDGYRFLIGLQERAPINWFSPNPYVTFLFLPLPVLCDIVTFPIQIIVFSQNPVWL